MTLDTPNFTTLDDAQHDRAANDDVDLDYGHGTAYVDAVQTTFVGDLADDITLTLFARLRNRNIDDLRVAVLAAGESWPPRRVWFSGYAAAHGITL